jgi:hypothetical protein
MPKNRIRFSDDFVLRNNLVGIGTSTPRAKLDVIGSALISGNTTISGNLSVGGSIFGPKISGVTTYIGILTAYNYTSGSPSISTNITEIKPYARANSTLSFLGYGNQLLTLDDDFSTDTFAVYNYSGKPLTTLPILNRETGTIVSWDPITANYEQAFRIDRSGNIIVGIGTTITAKLDVRGSVNLGQVPGSPGAGGTYNVHNISGDLNLYAYKIFARPGPPISTSNYIQISPTIGDTGSLNFYTGSASTTQLPNQLLSLTNNVSGSLFRVNNPNVGFASTTNLSVGISITAIFEVNSNGNVGVGTSVPTYLFTVSASGASPAPGLTNVLGDFTANTNSYSQVNTRNASNGASASSDIIATADTGTETTNFIDLGINNSGFSTSTWTINGALDGYLYTSDTNLSIGAASNKYVSFFTGGTTATNERLRVTGIGLSLIHI